jgi:hypothetical protein
VQDVRFFQQALQGEGLVGETTGAGIDAALPGAQVQEPSLPGLAKPANGLSELAKWARARWEGAGERDADSADALQDLAAAIPSPFPGATPGHVALADAKQAPDTASPPSLRSAAAYAPLVQDQAAVPRVAPLSPPSVQSPAVQVQEASGQDPVVAGPTEPSAALPAVPESSAQQFAVHKDWKDKKIAESVVASDDTEALTTASYRTVQDSASPAPLADVAPAARLSSLNVPDVVKAVQRTLAQRDLEGLSQAREVRLSLDDARLPQTTMVIKSDGATTFVELRSQSPEVTRFLTLRADEMAVMLAKEAPQVQISMAKDDSGSATSGGSQGNPGQSSQGNSSQGGQQQAYSPEAAPAKGSDRVSDASLVDRFVSGLNLNT